jgi:hypothetical protein
MDIYSLNKLTKKDLKDVGKKAAFLGELNKEFNIPEGFVISTKIFEKFLEQTKLKHQIDELLKDVNPNKYDFVQSRANKIQELIVKSDVPEDIKQEIIEFYESLDVSKHNVDKLDLDPDDANIENNSDNSDLINSDDDIFVAVRTSAVNYLASKVHINFFNIIGDDKLISAVKLCWASLFTAKAVYYYIEHDIKEISMAVLVQRMLIPSVSGRIDTVSDKSKNEMVVEACLGLGEAISSGLVLPDRYLINKENLEITKYRVNNQSVKLICDPDAEKTIRIGIAQDNAEKQKLDDHLIALVAKHAKKIEKTFQQPMRVEFAFEKGKLYILKALPLSEESLPKENAQEIIEESTSERFEDELVDEVEVKPDEEKLEEVGIDENKLEEKSSEEQLEQEQVKEQSEEELGAEIEESELGTEIVPEVDNLEQSEESEVEMHEDPEHKNSEPEVFEHEHQEPQNINHEGEHEDLNKLISEVIDNANTEEIHEVEAQEESVELNNFFEPEQLSTNDNENNIELEVSEELMATPDDISDGTISTDEISHEETAELEALQTDDMDHPGDDSEVEKVEYPNISHELSQDEEHILNNLPKDEGEVYVEREENEHKQEDINHMIDVQENKKHEEIDYSDDDHNEMMQSLEKIGKEDSSDSETHLSRQEEINYDIEGDVNHKNVETGSNNVHSEVFEEEHSHEELPHQEEINKEINQAINQQHEALVEEEQPIYEDEPVHTEEIELEPEHAVEYETDDHVTDDEHDDEKHNDNESTNEHEYHIDDSEENNEDNKEEEKKNDEHTYR